MRISPLAETALSLHALCGPRRHPLQHRWAREARSLPLALRRRIRTFRFAFRLLLPDLLLAQASDGFEAELARVEGLDRDVFALDLLRPLYDHGGRCDAAILRDPAVRRHALRAAERLGGSSATAALLFDDPEALRAELVSVLREYWHSAFAEEWGRLQPLLLATAGRLARALDSHGVYPVLARVSRLRVDAEREELAVDLPHDHRVEVTVRRPLSLVPSAYAWPQMHLNCDEPWPLFLVLPLAATAAEAGADRPPPELARQFRVLSDENRLQILRLLAERPRTPQELAPLLRLSESGLSRHLEQLRAAGLVSRRREGYWWVQRAELEALDGLFGALDAYLRPRH